MSAFAAATLDGGSVELSRSMVERHLGGLRGGYVLPDDPRYEDVRSVFNAMIDRHPALIIQCETPSDVVRAVEFTQAYDLLLAVRGGGHSAGGKSLCDGGIVIDLGPMKSVTVDVERRTAQAEPGLRLGEMDRATQRHELATPLGIVSDTGIAGLTLGGGIGWLNGAYGLSCDNVLAFEVVTADARLRTASPEENPELYWALRGGGGNFGIVTSFHYRLHRVVTVIGGMVLHPMDGARDVLRFYQDFCARSPDELSTAAALLTSPDGTPTLAIAACHCGEPSVAEKALAPLRSFGRPIADMLQPMEYTALQSMLDGAFPLGRHHYWKSSFVESLSDEALDVLLEVVARKPSPSTIVTLQQLHGAAARVPVTSTAFPHRRECFDLSILSQWVATSETEANVRWTRDAFDALSPYLDAAVYVNNLGEEGDDRVREAYGENYDRLAVVKSKYDPANLFRVNQNIRPADPVRVT